MAAVSRTFASRPGLGIASPPFTPRPKAAFGSYCFKAVCDIYGMDGGDDQGCPVRPPVGAVSGYDTTPAIGKATEMACRAQVNMLGSSKYRCSEARVVLLPNNNHSSFMPCTGELYFTIDGQTTRFFA